MNESTQSDHIARINDLVVTGPTFTFPPAKAVPKLMRGLFAKTIPRLASPHPVILAVKIHEDIVTIHPFNDGNSRIARLAMNSVLIQNGFLPVKYTPSFGSNTFLLCVAHKCIATAPALLN